MLGRQAGSPIAVYARVQCGEPKTGQEKVHFSSEDDLLFISSYYLSMPIPDFRKDFHARTLVFLLRMDTPEEDIVLQ